MTKKCYYCRNYIKHDEIFGYCKKYQEQAMGSENCKIIKELVANS